MKIKFFGLMLLAVVMVFALASCNGGGATTTQPAGNTYTITFEGANVAAITVAENTAATAPAAPTKVGYTFAGWTYAGEAWDWENIVISDMTLTASWTAVEYTLTLNLDGGVLTAPVSTYTIEGLTLPTPIKSGFAFGGWVDANGNPVANIAAGTTGALTLTAVWEAQADYLVDFDNPKQKLHYLEPSDSPVAITNNQTYSTGAGKRSDGGMQTVYSADVNFDASNPHILQFMKNERNWHETPEENGNKFLRVTLDSTLSAPKYSEYTAGQAYNVGLQFFTSASVNATNNAEDNCFTIKFSYRQANVGAFGINVYARGSGSNAYGQNRSTLLTIGTNGEVLINSDTINASRNAYTDGSNKLDAQSIGQTVIGEWNQFVIVMTETEEGHFVTITLNGTLLTATPLFLADTMTWSLKYDQIMFFGGDAAGQSAVEAIPGYTNNYDFDNVSVTGSYVDAE